MYSRLRTWTISAVAWLSTYLIFVPWSRAEAAAGAATEHAENIIKGLNVTAEKGGLIQSASNPPTIGPATVGGIVVGYLLSFVGVIFFALMIYGGITWMLSRGNAEQAKKAIEIIKSAILGLILVFLSYVVTRFVLTRLTGALQ